MEHIAPQLAPIVIAITGLIGVLIQGQKTRMEVKRMAVELEKTKRSADRTAAEVTPNGGSSMRDEITRTRLDVRYIRGDQGRQWDALDQVRRDGARAHREIFNRLGRLENLPCKAQDDDG